MSYFPLLRACVAIFEHIFFMLKAMAKKAKCIVTLSFAKCLKRQYASLFLYLCPVLLNRPAPHESVLVGLGSILVPSIYSTSSEMKPRSANSRTNWEKMLFLSFFTRLPKRSTVT